MSKFYKYRNRSIVTAIRRAKSEEKVNEDSTCGDGAEGLPQRISKRKNLIFYISCLLYCLKFVTVPLGYFCD